MHFSQGDSLVYCCQSFSHQTPITSEQEKQRRAKDKALKEGQERNHSSFFLQVEDSPLTCLVSMNTNKTQTRGG